MNIRYKCLIHERLNDAPFIGALIVGISCSLNCPGCFHEYMKQTENCTATSEELIAQVKSNPINRGVILAGLEWSEQPQELTELARRILESGLELIIYSGLDKSEFFQRIPELGNMPGIWFKFGKYDETKLVDDNITEGIKLASSNQYIAVTV